MNKNKKTGRVFNRLLKNGPLKTGIVFLSLSVMVLFPPSLAAQTTVSGEGYDYEGKASVAVLPFAGEEDDTDADVFIQAVVEAVTALRKYNPRQVNMAQVKAMGGRIPTDMPPVRELAPGARFALTGGVYPGTYTDEYYLQLWLWEMSGSTMIYTDDLVYQNIEEGLQAVPGLVEWLFSHIIEVVKEAEPPPKKGWEDKLLTVGVRTGVSQRWYTAPEETIAGARALNFEAGIFASVFLNPLLSVQTEIDFTFDNLVYRGISNIGQAGMIYTPVLANEKYTLYSLTIPVMLKANFRPGNFRIAPFAGLYAFAPLGETPYRKNPTGETGSFTWSSPAPLGFTAGFEGAVKFGPGMIIADIRYAGDFDSITIQDDADTSYKRNMLTFSVAYGFSFFDLNKGLFQNLSF
jgi:hypothetical protein